MAEYKYLFTPLKVGPIVLKNRIIFAPHSTEHFDRQHWVATERAKAYYEERARGGCAWIIIGTASVDERSPYHTPGKPGWWRDEVIPGVKDIVDRVHRHDCKISAQISHPGNYQWPIGELSIGYPAYGPSQVGSPYIPFNIPHELEVEEILEIEEKFADAAERVKKTGADGVEIMGVHGKLLSCFTSPIFNRRTDQYGGSVENMYRMWVEVAQKVRQRVGKDFLVGVRMIDREAQEGGLTVEQAAEGAKLIEATGAVDYISLCGGHDPIPSHYTGFEPGFRASDTAKIKAAVKIPVFMAGKINDPAVADRLIAEGMTDATLMCRQLIADPFLPKKAMEGEEEDIRPCLYCNHCAWLDFFAPGSAGVRCSVNAATGEEFKWGEGTLTRAPSRKKVLIVGAGPGGLECARTLAERGHEVVIYEKEKELGGQVRLLRKLPGHDEFYNLVDWLDRQVTKLRVKVNLGSEISENNLDQVLDKEKPDDIVCATGARAGRDGSNGQVPYPIPGHELKNVFTYEDAINGADLGNKVIVLDGLGERAAPGVAELLAKQGKQVELMSTDMWWQRLTFVWMEIGEIFTRLGEEGVKITPRTWVSKIAEDKVTCMNIFTRKMYEVEVDSVVLATAKYSNNELYKALKAKGIKSHLIGDAVAPRFVLNAVHDGHELARRI